MIVMILTVMLINITYVYSGNSKYYLYRNDFLTGNCGRVSTAVTAAQ